MTVRIAARAVLFDDDGRLVLIKRTRPGMAPYWTTPGGKIEPSDASLEGALQRELMEELGATAELLGEVLVVESAAEHPSWQHFFLARLLTMEKELRYGLEFSDAGRDSCAVEHIEPSRLGSIDLRPADLVPLVRANQEQLLGISRRSRCADRRAT